ncbi:MAG TPA: DUF418 domain-containing protein [Sphingomicrobium sp.]|nr:DUF418 domain-containing protein [Sphingomicrobium sp.]
MDKDGLGPVGESERVEELDVLRGLALFGVLAMNFAWVGGPGFGITEAQAAALPTATLDYYAYWGIRWLIGDKANTVFATLFGLGFYLQMQRGQGRPGFEARYRRRLFWLLVFGILNTLFLWVGDILNLYAIAGFLLLAIRRWSTRAFVIFGSVAALYSDKVQDWLIERFTLPVPSSEALWTDAGIVERQQVLASGDYAAITAYWAHFTWVDWLLSGMMVAWVVYALGRFALGAAIGRSGILSDVRGHLPLLRRIAWIALPAGLLFGFVIRLLYTGGWEPLGDENEGLEALARMLRSPAALLLAAGYCAAIVVAFHKPWGRRLFGLFAPVGRMALTNYLAQGFIYAFVLYGAPLGLGLAGRIGMFAIFLISIAFFAFQVAFSHWWLARYRFGPMEWLWRWLTYGERPAFRRCVAAPQPA